MGDVESAKDILNYALAVANEIKNASNRSYALRDIAEVLAKIGDVENAKIVLNYALIVADEIIYSYDRSKALKDLSVSIASIILNKKTQSEMAWLKEVGLSLKDLEDTFKKGDYGVFLKNVERVKGLVKRVRELESRVKSARDVTIPDGLREIGFEGVKTVSQLEEYVKRLEKEVEEVLSSKPRITIEVIDKSLKKGWNPFKVKVKNEGYGHAYDLTVTLRGDINTMRIKPVTVEGMKSETIEIPLKPIENGRIPIEISTNYRDSSGRTFEDITVVWVEIEGDHREEKSEGIRRDGISVGWTIYDPAKQRFVLKPKCEKPIGEWIQKHDPFSYWIAVCITNEREEPITAFELEFEAPTLLEVKGAYVEGLEAEVPVTTVKGGFQRLKHVVTVSEHLGVSIPPKGSKRVYIDIHSKACGNDYTIENGVVRTENAMAKLNDLDFHYSCELLNVKENPKMIETDMGRKLMEYTFKEKFGEHWKKVLEITNDIIGLIDSKERRAIKYVDKIVLLKNVSNDRVFQEFYKDLEYRIERVFLESPCPVKFRQFLKNNPNYNAELREEDLQKILSCLTDSLYRLVKGQD
jgi:hypothetical protein